MGGNRKGGYKGREGRERARETPSRAKILTTALKNNE